MNDCYNVSFRCFYDDNSGVHWTTHYFPAFPVADIPRWMDAYKFTHPNCTAISVKVWFTAAPSSECVNDVD